MIYLDNSATTKPDPTVLQSFQQVSEKYFANPSSLHSLGGEVEKLYLKAREQAATLLGVATDEIIFTSGGTEGNNLAIKGITFEHQLRGKHIITTEIEHPSVYETIKSLERFGFEVTYLPVNENGIISVAALEGAIRDDTILISVMHVNNETGSLQPIEKIGEIAKKYPKLFFHVDAVQGIGKVPLKLAKSGIDLCTFSGHKIHGIKGTGLLYVKKGTTIYPLCHGGGQEYALRSGTENVAGNVANVRALRLILERQKNEISQLRKLQQYTLKKLHDISGVFVNTPEKSAPHIINISVPGIKPETIIHLLAEKGIYISTRSACSSKQSENSRVLTACGYESKRSMSGLRISLSYDSTQEEMDVFLKELEKSILHLKGVLE